MKRFIISLILIFSIYCDNIDDCENADSKCNTYSIEGYTCNQFEDEGCIAIPSDKQSQEAYFNVYSGLMKEMSCTSDSYEDFAIELPSKKYFSSEETITTPSQNLEEKDKKILEKKNLCSYLFFGDYLLNSENYTNGYPEITEKTKCFNVDQFDDLKNLIDCGYAEITYTDGSEKKKLKTCFYIPNNNIPEKVLTLFKRDFVDEIFDDLIKDILDTINGGNEEEEEDGERRRLSSLSYDEIVVENKNGKKVKYTSDSNTIEIVEKGKDDNSLGLELNILILLICSLFLF